MAPSLLLRLPSRLFHLAPMSRRLRHLPRETARPTNLLRRRMEPPHCSRLSVRLLRLRPKTLLSRSPLRMTSLSDLRLCLVVDWPIIFIGFSTSHWSRNIVLVRLSGQQTRFPLIQLCSHAPSLPIRLPFRLPPSKHGPDGSSTYHFRSPSILGYEQVPIEYFEQPSVRRVEAQRWVVLL